MSEEVEAGKSNVTFRQSEKYGFSVYVADKGLLGLSSVSLSRQQAKTFAPQLKKSVELAKYVDKVIDQALSKN